jgi:hypothetical protein
MAMGSFFQAMFNEMGARRRRLRSALGERGQPLIELLVLGGLVFGSLGLFLGDWMPGAAPWGFAVPLVFLVGYLLIEGRRQRSLAAAEAEHEAAPAVDDDGRTAMDRMAIGHDWLVVLWSMSCALLGAAAFAIAWTARPVAHEEPVWTPPESTVSVDIPE